MTLWDAIKKLFIGAPCCLSQSVLYLANIKLQWSKTLSESSSRPTRVQTWTHSESVEGADSWRRCGALLWPLYSHSKALKHAEVWIFKNTPDRRLCVAVWDSEPCELKTGCTKWFSVCVIWFNLYSRTLQNWEHTGDTTEAATHTNTLLQSSYLVRLHPLNMLTGNVRVHKGSKGS